jgi:GntR family transcriptional repressor for pyruvate dehydrogenase complex
VVGQLRRLIDDGVLRAGDQLPSERELSDRLRVSRSTVREAVQFLHALGIVEIRHGAGTFVRSAPDPQTLRSEWRRWTLRHADRVHELLDVRRALEGLAAELGAERQPEEALDAMLGALRRMDAARAEGDVPTLVQADVLFHRALCEASGNRALVELADALGAQLVRERAATWDLAGRAERSLEEHGDIYEAVRAGDAEAARGALVRHLTSVEHDLAGLREGRLPAPPGDGERARQTALETEREV